MVNLVRLTFVRLRARIVLQEVTATRRKKIKGGGMKGETVNFGQELTVASFVRLDRFSEQQLQKH